MFNRKLRISSSEVLRPEQSGRGYTDYLRIKFAQVRDVAVRENLSTAVLVHRVVEAHTRQIMTHFPEASRAAGEPLTKLLDEANYRP